MQRLSGRQIRELQEVLLDAFPARDDLRMMVRVELDEQLETVADGPNQRVVIFNLVNWAEQTGRLDELVQAAARYNAGNAALQQLARTWRTEAGANPAADPAASQPTAAPVGGGQRLAGRRWLIVGLAAALVVVLGGLGLYLLTQTPLRPGVAGSATAIGDPGGSQAGTAAAPTAAQTATTAQATGQATAQTTAAAPAVGPTADSLAAGTNRSPVTAVISSSATITTNAQDGSVYVYVPAGPFIMGSDDAVEEAADNEKPQQTDLVLDAFWIMRNEVTSTQYARCVQAGACLNHYYDPKRGELPIADVSWHDANDYAAWVGGRLPTEAEWEKACRGTEGFVYPWGNDPLTTERANFGRNNDGPAVVGSYPTGVSPFGLLDMSGNVSEWTSSQFKPYPYAAYDGREDLSGDADRTVRGGGWASYRGELHCAARIGVAPGYKGSGIGFRVVLR